MDEAVIKRIPPHNIEAEQAVIGSMLMDPEAIQAALQVVTASDFYQRQYGVLFEAIVELNEAGISADMVTLANKLREKDLPEELASVDVITDLVNAVPTSVNVAQYAEIVYEKSMLRQLIRVTEGIASTCYQDHDSLENVLESTEKQVFDIIQKRHEGSYEDIRTVILRVLDSIEAASRIKGTVTGIPTGFYDLDYMTAGLQKSDLVLIAARPSMGKTAFVLNLAEHAIIKKNVSTMIFSLEMSKEQLINRMLSMNSRVDSQAMRTGDLQDDDWSKLVESARDLGNTNLVIDDTPGITVQELRSKCRKMKLERNLGLVIIDYLQLMSGSANGKNESRQQEISEISRGLKAVAREIGAPVIACSQLSRGPETRENKRPMLSDLRESGAIEQDADVVMFLYRDEYYNKDTEEPGVTEVIIGKQRNGPTGTVKLKWMGQYQKFVNMERRKEG